MTNMSKDCLKQIRLDSQTLSGRDALAGIMRKELDLPQSFTGNLDAFSDYLGEVVDDTVFEVEASFAEGADGPARLRVCGWDASLSCKRAYSAVLLGSYSSCERRSSLSAWAWFGCAHKFLILWS